eukprot:gene11990-5391_t
MKNYLEQDSSHFSLFDQSVTLEQLQELELNLELSSRIYATVGEFDFNIQDLPEFQKEFNSIIDPYEDISLQLLKWNNFGDIKVDESFATAPNVQIGPNEPKVVNQQDTFEDVKKIFDYRLKETNGILEKHQLEKIDENTTSVVISRLTEVQTKLFIKYDKYFQIEEPKKTKHKNMTHLRNYKIHYFKHEYLNPISYFKIKRVDQLFKNPPEILSIGSIQNIHLKTNEFSIFAPGEIDCIIFKENNSNDNFDHFRIVFSGSNSSEDWNYNFDFFEEVGFISYLAHGGITELWGTYTKKTMDLFLNEIHRRYNNMDKSRTVRISLTGHSLGAAFCLESAIYLKTEITKIFGDEAPIEIKVFLNGSPAIFPKIESEKVEKLLKKENIFHLVTEKDPISIYSQLQSKYHHIGKPFVLKNLTQLSDGSILTNMEYHLCEKYIALFKEYVHGELFEIESLKKLNLLKKMKFEFQKLMILREYPELNQELYIPNELLSIVEEIIKKGNKFDEKAYFDKINIDEILNSPSIPIVDIFEYKTSTKSILTMESTSIELKIMKLGSKIQLGMDYFIDDELKNEIAFSPDIFRSFYEGYLKFILGKYSEAIECFLFAPQHPYTQLLIGECFLNGLGVKKSKNYAFECFKNSNRFENPVSKYKLGFCYLEGIGCDVNQDTAIQLITESSNEGYSNALFLLGSINYENNKQNSESLFSQSDTNSKSQCMLGRFFKSRNEYQYMFHWYKLSADQNNIDGIHSLVQCYYNGHGCQLDRKKFFELSLKASNLGCPIAKKN